MGNILLKAVFIPIVIVFSLLSDCLVSFAATFNVNTTVQLRKALDDAAVNGEDDTVILAAGTYKTSIDGKGAFIFSDYKPNSLIIKAKEGLFSDDVVLDGSGQHQVFNFYSSGVTLERLSVINGFNGVHASQKLAVIKCNISGNDGNGIEMDDGGVLTVSDSVIADNASAGIYGGKSGGAGRVLIINSTVSGNGDTGVVNKGSAPGPVFVINSIISGHSGKGIYGWNGNNTLYVINSVIAGNADGIWGRGIFVNNIFQNNSGRDIYFLSNSSYFESKVYNNYIDNRKLDNEVSHTVTDKGNIHPGEGVLKFSDSSYRPNSASVVIDKGLSQGGDPFKKLFSDSSLLAIVLDGLSSDKDGNQRTLGAAVDMGPYEYVPVYTLAISISGTGGGTVSASGLSCSNNVCTGKYSSGSKVAVTAKPVFGSAFVGWSSKCAVTGPCKIAMDGDVSITATFNKLDSVVCPYALTADKKTVGASANTGSVKVKTESICSWTATSNSDWITLSSGVSGAGNGTVGYSVASNSGPTARIGTLTIAGKTLIVTQQGLPELSGAWSKVAKKQSRSKYRVTGVLTVNNTGGSSAANVKAKIYMSDDNALDGNDSLLTLKPVAIGTIKANGKLGKALGYSVSSDPSGKYLIAVIDPDSRVSEADESNNTAVSVSAVP